MGFFIGQEGMYYEGDRANQLDIEVPKRPSDHSEWDGSAWVSGAAAKAASWEAIKAKRDSLRFGGGVNVGGHWFRSDQTAVGEYNSLRSMSADLPDSTVLRAAWRTMDGAKVDMTPALVKQILFAGIAQVAAIDDAAEAHKVAMMASDDPSAYDFSAGWPATFVS